MLEFKKYLVYLLMLNAIAAFNFLIFRHGRTSKYQSEQVDEVFHGKTSSTVPSSLPQVSSFKPWYL